MADTLTARQRAFVREYLISRNGTDAARKAGYKGSEKTLSVTASRDLLGNPRVAAEISAAEALDAERYEIKRANLIRDLKAIAEGNPGRIYDWTNNPDGSVATFTLRPKADLTDADLKFLDAVQFETRFEYIDFKDEEGQTSQERVPITKLKVSTLGKEKVPAMRLLAEMGGHLNNPGAGDEQKELDAAIAVLDMEESEPRPAAKVVRKPKRKQSRKQ